MKISETIERDCCQYSDLKEYCGEYTASVRDFKFCQYCGQLWTTEQEQDPSGNRSNAVQIKVVITDWKIDIRS